MRALLSLVAACSLVAVAPAADLPIIRGTIPNLVLAQAASKDGKATLTVKYPVTVCVPKTRTVAMDVVKKVDGKDVTEKITKEVTVIECVTEWKVMEVRLGDAGVAVTDASGKAVSRDDVLKRLEKETAILRAIGGPPDPFYLQTTKSDTLILVTPQQPQPVVPAPAEGKAPLPAPKEKGPLSAPPTVAKPKNQFNPLAKGQDVIGRTNAERKNVNLPTSTAATQLLKAARLRSANFARQDKLDHTLDDKTPDQRDTDAGYKWARTGENIAKGQRTPEAAITSWISSQGHRDNNLPQEYVEIGVAVSEAKDGRKYWTMVLARPR